MKRSFTFFLSIVLLVFLAAPVFTHAAGITYQARVYDTDGEGLALKSSPDINSERYALLPDGTNITIDQTSDGWGHTYYNGTSGWVYLQYTRVLDRVISEYPTYGFTDMKYYLIQNTEGEGLELRTAPTEKSSTFGAIKDGAVVTVQAVQGNWAYTYYNGNFGWAAMDYMTPFNGRVYYRATVYDTDGEGLSLKKNPGIDSEKYLVIPENSQLNIDQVTKDGWGRTSYNGYTGWVSLRYTRIVGDYCSDIPVQGYINAAYYTVHDTDGEGLELRSRPTVESSTYGPVYDGTSVLVQAISEDWAFLSYNGHYGWCNMTYLR